MRLFPRHIFFSFFLVSAVLHSLSCPCSAQKDVAATSRGTGGEGWDNAVNSLLAASMYGFEDLQKQGLSLQLQHAEGLIRDLHHDNKSLDAQSITFSYEGSSGLLGFSAGYIYTGRPDDMEEHGRAFLGIDPVDDSVFTPARSWYLAFDLSQNYQFDKNLMFGFGSTTMLTKNPFDTEEGKTFSMLFNMPISFKQYFTITPQFQWSRVLPDEENITFAEIFSEEKQQEDVFYGGVSFSFSY